VRYDTRNDADDPWSGWYVTGEYEYGVGRIVEYGPTSRAIREINPTGRNAFDRVLLDVRRYNRISAEAQLNLRLVAGGWLSGDDLPLQRRFSLGSAGSLPGYDFRQIRPAPISHLCRSTSRARPADHGLLKASRCERFALGQIEYRGEIGTSFFGLLTRAVPPVRGVEARSGWCSETLAAAGWSDLALATCNTGPARSLDQEPSAPTSGLVSGSTTSGST
jgi:hypothetical protein